MRTVRRMEWVSVIPPFLPATPFPPSHPLPPSLARSHTRSSAVMLLAIVAAAVSRTLTRSAPARARATASASATGIVPSHATSNVTVTVDVTVTVNVTVTSASAATFGNLSFSHVGGRARMVGLGFGALAGGGSAARVRSGGSQAAVDPYGDTDDDDNDGDEVCGRPLPFFPSLSFSLVCRSQLSRFEFSCSWAPATPLFPSLCLSCNRCESRVVLGGFITRTNMCFWF
jgi:hypothetical protein